MSENQTPEEVNVEAPNVSKVVHTSNEDAVVAGILSSSTATAKWTKDEIKTVVETVQEGFQSAYTNVLDRVKALHSDYTNVKYRFVTAERDRLAKAINIEKFKAVNRTNHPRLTDDLVNDALGAVVCAGEILMFRPVEIDDAFRMRYRKKHDDRANEIEDRTEDSDRFYKGGTSIGKISGNNDGLAQTDDGSDFAEVVAGGED